MGSGFCAFGYFAITVVFCILFDFADVSPRKYADQYERVASHAMAVLPDSPLFQAIAPETKRHEGQSGFQLIFKDSEALRIRLEMIDAASQSLDLQYYSIADDTTDQLVIEALLRAAQRGVRIRLLIDDVTLKKSDKIWTMLDTTPHISLRVFNPFATSDQSWFVRMTDVVSGVSRFTKRMHNKLFIADNLLGVIGGRNLGDAYFGSSETVNFRDLDVFAAGPLVQGFSQSFDDFWNGREAFPLRVVAPLSLTAGERAQLRSKLATHWDLETAKPEFLPLEALVERLQHKTLPLIWAAAELAADAPGKIESATPAPRSVPANDLRYLLSQAKEQFIAVSPYFIPGDGGIDLLKRLNANGVKTVILTNSLASTDVVAVHAGYARYREEVLKAGAELYELEPVPGKYPRPGRFSPSRRASLHSKVFIIDGKIAVIGSFNIDPRSQKLNTEVVVVIHSPELSRQLLEKFREVVGPSNSFHVELPADASGAPLKWTGEKDGKPITYVKDPPSGFWRPIMAKFLSFLPFEIQL